MTSVRTHARCATPWQQSSQARLNEDSFFFYVHTRRSRSTRRSDNLFRQITPSRPFAQWLSPSCCSLLLVHFHKKAARILLQLLLMSERGLRGIHQNAMQRFVGTNGSNRNSSDVERQFVIWKVFTDILGWATRLIVILLMFTLEAAKNFFFLDILRQHPVSFLYNSIIPLLLASPTVSPAFHHLAALHNYYYSVNTV